MHRIEFPDASIDELLGEVTTSAVNARREGVYLRDERRGFAPNGQVYRCQPDPRVFEVVGATDQDPDTAFFGNGLWLHVVVRDDGSKLLVAGADSIIASRWLTLEPAS